MPDLFISYSSHDKPWADRLYAELKARYPTLDIFLDHKSIPAGADWRKVLVETGRVTQNLVALWSEKAKASQEVGPEIQAFDQAREMAPKLNGLDRTLFYVPLEGDYGPLQAIQSFVRFREKAVYDASLPDRGVSKLDTEPLQSVLLDCVRWIGDSIARSNPVTLAVLAMNSGIVDLLDPMMNFPALPGYPNLPLLLSSLGLTLADVKKRYGPTVFDWHPFGTAQTVTEIMEDVRQDTNPKLNDEFRFQWKEVDLYGEMVRLQAVEPVVQALIRGGPSALVIDPISLHNIVIKQIFDKLGEYFARPEAIVLTLAPNQNPWLESLLLSIYEKGGNILNPYFNPFVPAAGTFAGCGLNLGHRLELTRLVRYGLGLYHSKRKRQTESELIKMV